MMKRVTTVLVMVIVASSAVAQLPDSPTGRMARALAALTQDQDDAALERFLEQRAAPDVRTEELEQALAGLRKTCANGKIRGAEKTGPASARIVLSGGTGADCTIVYSLEAEDPHRLIELAVELSQTGGEAAVGAPSNVDARIEGFVAALNSGKFERMQAFYADGVTEGFRTRRSEDEDRALYERLRNDLGRLDVQRIMRRSPDEVHVVAISDRIPEPVQLTFELRDDRIHGLSVRVGGPEEQRSSALDLPEGADDEVLARALDRQLDQLAGDGEFSGVVLLARNGKPVFHSAYGMANRSDERPNSTDTRFDIGSITKLMTKIAVARLLQAGKLSPDDTILDHLPDYPDRSIAAKITVQHLLDHSSGLGDIFNDRWDAMPKDKLVSPRDFFPLFADRPLQFEPGRGKSYSNAGYIVLGAIVEAVSGQSYAEYLGEHLFRPAGMSRSGFPLRDGKSADLAIGYTRQGPGGDGGAPRPNTGMLPIRGCPAGSSAHTAEDLLKLDQALRSGKLLEPEWVAWVYTGAKSTTPEADYPLGVAGGGPGVSACFESDGATTAIVLSNLDPPMAEDLAIQLYRAMN